MFSSNYKLSFTFLISICFHFGQSAKAQDAPLLIRGATIIDIDSGETIPNQSVKVKDGRISEIGTATNVTEDDGTTVIEAQGKYLIPGLWDMHIHWYERKTMSLFPINGVTGVRVMWGIPDHLKWKESFESGASLGPRMYIGGTIIDGPKPIWPGSLVVDSAESAKKAIQATKESKYDFAKVYSLLSHDAFMAIVNECKQMDLPFAGHVPRMVSAKEASEAGQKSMEHMYEILLTCSSEEETLRQMLADHVEKNNGGVRSLFNEGALLEEVSKRALDSYDEQKAAKLFKLFAENKTYQCPTLTVLRNIAYLETPEIQNNPNLKYLGTYLRNSIGPSKLPRLQSEAQLEFSRKQFKFLQHLVPAMHEQGVPILAGTDVLNPFCLPGFSLHDELKLLVDSGLKPIDALRSATIVPATFMQREQELGSIKTGYLADMVLLDENPLTDISNTKRIHAVITRGKHLTRTELDAMLSEFEAQNRPKEKSKK